MGYSATSIGQYQAWVPTLTGFSSDPTGITARYVLNGKMCVCYFTYTGNGTSNATTKTITLPFAAANTGIQIFPIRVTDNGTIQTTVGQLITRVNSNIADVGKVFGSTTNWTSSGNAGFVFSITYETA
jgi:hypothetical protein